MPQTILVVDDNDQNRVLLKDVLTLFGYNILLARNGEEGVQMAQEHHPAMILMDIHMPVMNGLEACRLLRSDPRTKDIRILSLTSFSSLDDTDKPFASGFDGFIGKPLDIRELPKIILGNLPGDEIA